jgi:hypothetical protein
VTRVERAIPLMLGRIGERCVVEPMQAPPSVGLEDAVGAYTRSDWDVKRETTRAGQRERPMWVVL